MSSASRKSVVSALVRYASSSSRSRPKPRPSGGAPAAGVSDPNQLVPGSPTSSSSLQDSSSSSDTWVEVRDPKSNQIYYWNRSTNETTAVGEARPGPLGRQPAMPGQARSLFGLVGMGAGVGLVFALISRIF
ncbi:hypothetical protein Ndes2526B_g07330 [Nannochloris sp. 'desiccata']|nr:hypothetical protein NADE_000585 [Chlorella desiccata (nom. nud.)]